MAEARRGSEDWVLGEGSAWLLGEDWGMGGGGGGEVDVEFSLFELLSAGAPRQSEGEEDDEEFVREVRQRLGVDDRAEAEAEAEAEAAGESEGAVVGVVAHEAVVEAAAAGVAESDALAAALEEGVAAAAGCATAAVAAPARAQGGGEVRDAARTTTQFTSVFDVDLLVHRGGFTNFVQIAQRVADEAMGPLLATAWPEWFTTRFDEPEKKKVLDAFVLGMKTALRNTVEQPLPVGEGWTSKKEPKVEDDVGRHQSYCINVPCSECGAPVLSFTVHNKWRCFPLRKNMRERVLKHEAHIALEKLRHAVDEVNRAAVATGVPGNAQLALSVHVTLVAGVHELPVGQFLDFLQRVNGPAGLHEVLSIVLRGSAVFEVRARSNAATCDFANRVVARARELGRDSPVTHVDVALRVRGAAARALMADPDADVLASRAFDGAPRVRVRDVSVLHRLGVDAVEMVRLNAAAKKSGKWIRLSEVGTGEVLSWGPPLAEEVEVVKMLGKLRVGGAAAAAAAVTTTTTSWPIATKQHAVVGTQKQAPERPKDARDIVSEIESGASEVSLTLLGDRDVDTVAQAVARSTSLATLYLGDNQITDVGATKLAEAVARSTSLTKLYLGGNQITNVGVTKLAEAVARSTSLTVLYLSGNKIADMGAAKLAEAVERSTSLTKLDLTDNQITDVGAFALAQAFVRSSKLRFLSVSGNRQTARGEKALDAAHATAKATRPTLWLLCGAPTAPSSPAIIWRRFILEKDGDHAIWSSVMDFLIDHIDER